MKWLRRLYCRHPAVAHQAIDHATGRALISCVWCGKRFALKFGPDYARFMRRRRRVYQS